MSPLIIDAALLIVYHRQCQPQNSLSPCLDIDHFPPLGLTVYRSVVQSILLYAMDSAQLTPPQLTRIDHVHFQSIRRIFGIKSSFYHRVFKPTNEDSSNQYLVGLSYNSRRVMTPPQIYSQNRFTLRGHLFRHRDSLEFHLLLCQRTV